jgi:hypothetical protein
MRTCSLALSQGATDELSACLGYGAARSLDRSGLQIGICLDSRTLQRQLIHLRDRAL